MAQRHDSRRYQFRQRGAGIALKLKFFNHVHSVKDRVAVAMLDAAERDGKRNAEVAAALHVTKSRRWLSADEKPMMPVLAPHAGCARCLIWSRVCVGGSAVK